MCEHGYYLATKFMTLPSKVRARSSGCINNIRVTQSWGALVTSVVKMDDFHWIIRTTFTSTKIPYDVIGQYARQRAVTRTEATCVISENSRVRESGRGKAGPRSLPSQSELRSI